MVLRTDPKPFSGAPTGEVALEKEFVGAANKGWWIQTPTASGFNVRGARKRSIDLVWESRPSEFRFIELKCNPRTNNPIYAAAELIEYGIFYWIIRSRADLREKLCKDSGRLLETSTTWTLASLLLKLYRPILPSPEQKRKLITLGKRISEGFDRLATTSESTLYSLSSRTVALPRVRDLKELSHFETQSLPSRPCHSNSPSPI